MSAATSAGQRALSTEHASNNGSWPLSTLKLCVKVQILAVEWVYSSSNAEWRYSKLSFCNNRVFRLCCYYEGCLSLTYRNLVQAGWRKLCFLLSVCVRNFTLLATMQRVKITCCTWLTSIYVSLKKVWRFLPLADFFYTDILVWLHMQNCHWSKRRQRFGTAVNHNYLWHSTVCRPHCSELLQQLLSTQKEYFHELLSMQVFFQV